MTSHLSLFTMVIATSFATTSCMRVQIRKQNLGEHALNCEFKTSSNNTQPKLVDICTWIKKLMGETINETPAQEKNALLLPSNADKVVNSFSKFLTAAQDFSENDEWSQELTLEFAVQSLTLLGTLAASVSPQGAAILGVVGSVLSLIQDQTKEAKKTTEPYRQLQMMQSVIVQHIEDLKTSFIRFDHAKEMDKVVTKILSFNDKGGFAQDHLRTVWSSCAKEDILNRFAHLKEVEDTLGGRLNDFMHWAGKKALKRLTDYLKCDASETYDRALAITEESRRVHVQSEYYRRVETSAKTIDAIKDLYEAFVFVSVYRLKLLDALLGVTKPCHEDIVDAGTVVDSALEGFVIGIKQWRASTRNGIGVVQHFLDTTNQILSEHLAWDYDFEVHGRNCYQQLDVCTSSLKKDCLRPASMDLAGSLQECSRDSWCRGVAQLGRTPLSRTSYMVYGDSFNCDIDNLRTSDVGIQISYLKRGDILDEEVGHQFVSPLTNGLMKAVSVPNMSGDLDFLCRNDYDERDGFAKATQNTWYIRSSYWKDIQDIWFGRVEGEGKIKEIPQYRRVRKDDMFEMFVQSWDHDGGVWNYPCTPGIWRANGKKMECALEFLATMKLTSTDPYLFTCSGDVHLDFVSSPGRREQYVITKDATDLKHCHKVQSIFSKRLRNKGKRCGHACGDGRGKGNNWWGYCKERCGAGSCCQGNIKGPPEAYPACNPQPSLYTYGKGCYNRACCV